MSRLNRITTKAGDGGTTRLGDGTEVQKDHPRVEAMGTIDELNSALGILLAGSEPELPATVYAALAAVQHDLFDLGSELAVPGSPLFPDAALADVEAAAEALNADLPPLAEFVLPGGSPATAACHLARTICRRAERRLITLGHLSDTELRPELGRYLNRLSDLLFICCRCIQRGQHLPELQWDRDRRSTDEDAR